MNYAFHQGKQSSSFDSLSVLNNMGRMFLNYISAKGNEPKL